VNNETYNWMKKRGLTIVILVILTVIIAVIVVDFLNNRPDRRGENPYALEVDQYKEVDPELISHRETRNFDLGLLIPSDMTLYDRALYVSGNSSLVVIPLDGGPAAMHELLPGATCLEVDQGHIFVGFKSHVAKYSHEGELLQEWPDLGERAVVTNLAILGDRIFVADAGNRRIVIFNREGQQLGEFEGKAESEDGHGFIIPSANFDLAVNSFGELWVVNPAKHSIENYSEEGRMRGFWQSAAIGIEGFQGCCNPARITVMEDGSFVTSEKGMVRIKIHDQSGALISVVAPPASFEKPRGNQEEGKAPEVCADEKGVVYALDFDRDVIRVFEPIESE
jgi:hypothetical protein